MSSSCLRVVIPLSSVGTAGGLRGFRGFRTLRTFRTFRTFRTVARIGRGHIAGVSRLAATEFECAELGFHLAALLFFALDVDAPASQLGREAHILALLADG